MRLKNAQCARPGRQPTPAGPARAAWATPRATLHCVPGVHCGGSGGQATFSREGGGDNSHASMGSSGGHGRSRKSRRRSRSPPKDQHRGGGGSRPSSARRDGAISGAFGSFVKAAALTAAAKATSELGRGGGSTAPEGSPGSFDLYLFAQSWAPRFCCTNAKQCKASGLKGQSDLGTHGLWPAFNKASSTGRTYPQFCSSEESGGSGREKHEWEKHGTYVPHFSATHTLPIHGYMCHLL